ncbi:MAG TPA: STAS domain-containing protein [Terriglobales bacterium]|jgi:anti-anti-sigma factor|nr:STAS domain-containing protein [Terriglobales bacterium]
METSRPVVVKRMPEKVNQQEARKFFADVQPFLTSDRPQLVFDLSLVKQLDAAGIEMLLQCVAEVMKRDGDLKLASLSRQASMVLELTRTDRLFEVYENSTEAARSFSGFLPNAMQSISAYPKRAADSTQLAA